MRSTNIYFFVSFCLLSVGLMAQNGNTGVAQLFTQKCGICHTIVFTDNGENIEGWRLLPQLYAALLLLMAILFFFGTINRKPKSTRSTLERLAPLRETRVWRFGLFYFFVFGSFVALSQWLIPYYVNVYAMSIVSAGLMATIFSLPAGVIRAAGGWLSDRVGARIVLQWVLGVCTVCLFFLFVPRMEIQAPGQGVMAGKSGKVTSVSSGNIGIDNDLYVLQSAEGDSSHVSIRFGIHQDQERFLLLPTASFHQEPMVDVGEQVVKGQLLAKGVTYIYFQANKWIFTTLIFIIGIMMGLGGAAVYKNIATFYPANVGAVGGIVGVLGGLGGFISPTIFGYLLKATGVWTTSWMFLAFVSFVCILLHQSDKKRLKIKESSTV